MANTTNSKARQSHTLPGVYHREQEVVQSVKSLGKTKIGLVGEAETGKAFDPTKVTEWGEYTKKFGGLNADLFPGSKYPKYELPYVAKEVLTEANDVTICRVLGLSGYNAGPAWLITASRPGTDSKPQVVAVLRARGSYAKSVMFNKYANTAEACKCQYTAYDTLTYAVGEKTNSETCTGVTGYNADAVKLNDYYSIDNVGNECEGYSFGKSALASGATGFYVSNANHGSFTIECYKQGATEPFAKYPVSLNSGDKNYIINVLGSTAEKGSAPLWVEALYDVNLEASILAGDVTQIDRQLHFVDVYYTSQFCGMNLVYDFLSMGQENLTKRQIGARYLFDNQQDGISGNTVMVTPYDPVNNKPMVATVVTPGTETSLTVYEYTIYGTDTIHFSGNTCMASASTIISTYFGTGYTTANIVLNETNQVIQVKNPAQGTIFTVRQFTDMKAKRNYVYAFYPEGLVTVEYGDGNDGYKVDIVPLIDKLLEIDGTTASTAKENYNPYKRGLALMSDGNYYRLYTDTDNKVYITRVKRDLNDYKSAYRHAMTPWFVSQIKGDATHYELTKLFRFHTINDGTSSNFQYKVSITNVRPDEGLFDVQIRDINDSDAVPVVVESKRDCSLVEGDSRYLGLMFGTIDGAYPQVSEYVSVEINRDKEDEVRTSVPAGFMGYPTKLYDGIGVSGATTNDIDSPDVVYNTIYDEDVKARAQYFGLSDRTGIDFDFFTYKGRAATDETDGTYLGNGFHLDCRLNPANFEDKSVTRSIDGVKGDWTFSTVDINSRTFNYDGAPVISNEVNMEDCIYADKNLRKFTAYFYGGFDGWDVYRDQRTNTDDFKANKYKGTISKSNGEGRTFERIQTATLDLEAGAITSDYYAYLAGARAMRNPLAIDVNVLATLGFDYVNQNELSKEVLDLVDDPFNGRKDLIYVMITPDKPSGAGDGEDEMFTPAEVVDNLEASDIDTSYACTYYPWGQFYDSTNNKYIYLSPTKDILRSMCYTDRETEPWFAPAGMKRGKVNFKKMRHKLTKEEGDLLYKGYINPMLTQKDLGAYIWGQKTMYRRGEEVQLTRVNIRRLMIDMRIKMENATIDLVFDPNDPTLLKQFKDAVNPILKDFIANRAISDAYFVAGSEGSSTADRRDITGKIAIQPYTAAEYFNFDYYITPEGTSFGNI